MNCKWTGCTDPKAPGRGSHYCDPHREEAQEQRRIDNIRRVNEWSRANPERHAILNNANRYGLHPDDEYLELLGFQDGCCAICRVFGGLKLELDHDHKTGAVRGFLCGPCNRLLALARDRAHVLDAAAAYLANPAYKQAHESVIGVSAA